MTMRAKWVAAMAAGVALAGLGTAATAAAAGRPASTAAARPATGPVPAGFEPASMTFISPSEGWVLGTAPCSHKPCTSVVWTFNGGKSWVGVPAPKYALGGPGSSTGLIRLRFANPSNGFAFGSQLWVTHTGGGKWYRVTQVPGYIGDLETSDGRAYAASLGKSGETIYRSPTVSDDWTKVAGLPTVSGYAGLGTIALHGTAAWIILGGRLYSSQTGSSWIKDDVSCPKLEGMASVAAYSSRQVTLLCAGNPAAGSTQKTLYASSDGGAHFTKVGAVPAGGDDGVLAEPTAKHLFVATSSGATWLYVSTNGGKSWKTQLFLADGGKGWNDFGFTTASEGEAIEGNPAIGSVMYMTSNAGGSWHKVKF
jgi:hypothetical protein